MENEIIKKLVAEKAKQDNQIDLDAYEKGLHDMFNEMHPNVILFGERMQMIRDIDLDGNIEFMFNPSASFFQMFK